MAKAKRRCVYIGVDPGESGGLVAYGPSFLSNSPSAYSIRSTSMPDTERDTWDWVEKEAKDAWDQGWSVFAVIEKVQGFIGQGQPGSAMFKFGVSYGGLRMALIAANVPFDEVPPQKWQKLIGITPRGKEESKGSFKNRLKSKAQQLFPLEKITLATADAFLLSEYCRRVCEGKL